MLATVEKSARVASDPFIAIPISSIRLDTITGFDLYMRMRPGEKPVLYAQRDVPFTEDSLARIRGNRIGSLYISSDQQQEYSAYLEKNLGMVLQDPRMNTKQKSEILYSAAHGLMENMLSDPSMDDGVRRSRDLIKNTVQFVFTDSTALRFLIRTAAVDYTAYSHSVNVCVMGIGLAKRMGITHPKQLRHFGLGALLRDIGMSQVEADIMDNPDTLTEEEFETMKQHPVLGEELLRELGGVTDLELDLVRHHHEHFDGSGYPDGLAGRDISLMARILSVVDVFDALTTNRPYQEKLSSFEAIKTMNRSMAAEFDPHVFKAFIGMMGNPS